VAQGVGPKFKSQCHKKKKKKKRENNVKLFRIGTMNHPSTMLFMVLEVELGAR
jgi:hypothetical protein